jgi:sialate O-acetylesterase
MVPQAITVKSTTGQAATLENILFGDVYICGGQSNMGFALPATTNGTQEAERGNQYPHIRLFTVGRGTRSNVPLPDLQTVEQPWSIANVESLYQHPTSLFGLFSSVCWFFGREISDGLDNQIPIGLIQNPWGGQRIEYFQPGGDLYNSMVVPFMIGPMSLTGFAWYQGESNTQDQTGDPNSEDEYATLFPDMVQSWRQGFHVPDAYFGFIQLSTWCPAKYPFSVPRLRRAQMEALKLPGKIAYATNADHGDGCNIHPPTKQYCGARLGRSALAVQYGQDLHWKSPSYDKATTIIRNNEHADETFTGLSVAIRFKNVSSNGLYIIDTPYNIGYSGRPTSNYFHCKGHIPGTCAGAQVLLNGKGWVDVMISVQVPDSIILTCQKATKNDTIVATSYGWGSVPLLTIYDRESNLPVLPWKETISFEHHQYGGGSIHSRQQQTSVQPQ